MRKNQRKDQVKTPGHDTAFPERHHLAAILDEAGISFSTAQLEQLWTYHQLIRRHNPELNLTRIHNFRNMALKLYVDSILPGQLMSLPSPLMDIGTGPGMPGIPLKIAQPHLEILLAESRQKRVEFLDLAVARLGLPGVEVVGQGISARFERPVAGIITRAVESMAATLERIAGCLSAQGLAIFMKGPHCDEEIEEALRLFQGEYDLVQDHPYRLASTSHERRLVVFRRSGSPVLSAKGRAMKRHATRRIESEGNDIFKGLKKLLSGRGIRKEGRAILSGTKLVAEALQRFPERCHTWISREEDTPPPEEAPSHLTWLQLAPSLYRELDVIGTGGALLVIEVPDLAKWSPSDGFPDGCCLLVPFQDPENVGAVIRSAVALGASLVILLAESAHPFHPKALRASGGTVLQAKLLSGPSVADLPPELPVVSLSSEGTDLATVELPERFGLLPGLEGPGLPPQWRLRAVAIPMTGDVESLNAATATGIVLYEWLRRKRAREREGGGI